mmetsp:Transcript_15002/g.31855  ORF Transcript_15002/g.31855 Transcript_15002/m.31855 type:complete len:105 (-) Transcript_15002:74-388(-)
MGVGPLGSLRMTTLTIPKLEKVISSEFHVFKKLRLRSWKWLLSGWKRWNKQYQQRNMYKCIPSIVVALTVPLGQRHNLVKRAHYSGLICSNPQHGCMANDNNKQ